jgi:hypothetical protein
LFLSWQLFSSRRIAPPSSPASSSTRRSSATRTAPVRPLSSPPSRTPLNGTLTGFLAIAQLPIVFLFASKNSVVSLLLGPGHGYEKLNFIHRWSGRLMFLAAVLHGALWIRNHLQYDLPIIGQQKEGSGVATLGLLGVIVVSSLPVARRWCYQVFYIMQ